MAKIIIVGDGPGGLSAALFLSKKGQHDVTVYGKDETAMHYAMLKNYLGLPDTSGVDFQDDARKQLERYGVPVTDVTVTAVRAVDGGVEVDAGDDTSQADYLILSEGQKAPLAESLGLEMTGEGIAVDRWGRTAVERVYAVGRCVRQGRSQAIISAGDGAAAALDIMSEIEGKDIQDWDS
ncbi:MAG: FAD-dependent oxidoreductase [Actinomycetota bacterium]